VVETATLGALVEAAPWKLPAGLAVIAAGFGAVWWLWRGGRLATLGLGVRVQAIMADWLGLPAAARLLVVNPVLVLSAALARVDDRVIDAGVRGVVAGARLLSRLASLRGEWTFDGAVRGLAAATMAAAAGSRAADDQGIDAAVEQTAAGVGAAGSRSRDLQTGLSHHYYVIIGVGLLVGLLVLAVLR
jgi:hypothetical protein